MRAISLFSGVGGFELAFDDLGIETVAQVENDPDCQQVLRRCWPTTARYGDVQTTKGREMIARHGPLDLLYGGFPCQGVSQIGRSSGLKDPRTGLWYEFRRLIEEVQPTWIVAENVPGLLSQEQGAAFGVIIDGLVQLGYGVGWRVLDSQYFGVPQRRRRLFLVGHLGGGTAYPGLVLAVPESGLRPPDQGEPSWKSAAADAAECSRSAGGGDLVVFDWQASDGGSDRSFRGGGRRYIVRAGAILGTLTATRNEALLVNGRARQLTLLERERAMGWPDHHTRYRLDGSEFSRGTRIRLTGNGVVTPVARWIGDRLVAVDALVRVRRAS